MRVPESQQQAVMPTRQSPIPVSGFSSVERPKIVASPATHCQAIKEFVAVGLAVFVIIGVIPVFPSANALEFEVHGRLIHTYHGFGSSDVKPYTNYANFSVFVRECQWLIQSTNSRLGAAERSCAGRVGEDVALVLGFESSSHHSSSR